MHASKPPTILFLFPFLTTGYLKNRTTDASIFVTSLHQMVYTTTPTSKILFFAMTPSLCRKGYGNLMLLPIRYGDRSPRSHFKHHQAIQWPAPRPNTYLDTQTIISPLLMDNAPVFAKSTYQRAIPRFSVTTAPRTGQIVRLRLILVAIWPPPNGEQSSTKAIRPIQSSAMTRNPPSLKIANSWNRLAKSLTRCEVRLTKLPPSKPSRKKSTREQDGVYRPRSIWFSKDSSAP